MLTIDRLHKTVSAVCPIDGVSIGEMGNSASVRVDFTAAATQVQRDATIAALASFDWSEAAHVAWADDQQPERKTLRQAAAQSVADIDTYLAISSPNNAQVVAQVRRLSQVSRQLIKRLIQLD